MKYIISLDQGTTSSRAIIFDSNANIVNVSQQEFTQYYPNSGWVEHNPVEILESQLSVLKQVIDTSQVDVNDIVGIGVTNQRETTVVWDKETGKPIYNAIVWQCRRTASICDDLRENGKTQIIKGKDRSCTGRLLFCNQDKMDTG